MKRVMVLTPFYPPKIGGAESFALRLVKELSKHYKVDVCTLTWEEGHTWEGVSKWEGIKVLIRLAPKAIRMCLKSKYDAVYALGLNATFIATFLKKVFKVKPTVTLLALYNLEKEQRIIKWALNSMEKIFVEGETGKRDALKMGAREDKIIKYNHWVDQSIYFPVDRKDRDEVTVLFASRPIHIKGKWIIEIVEQHWSREKLKAKFVYAENVPHKDMPKLFQQADILVVPSIYEEGFPLTIAEGASCGCVVIASNRGGLPEMVGPFGLVIEPDPLKFWTMIYTLSNDKYRLKKLRKLAIQYAKEHFSVKNVEVFI